MRRCLRGVLVVAVVAATALLRWSAPACACSCPMSSDAQYTQRADLAFEGVVVDIDEPLLSSSEGNPVSVRFLVESVSKGRAGGRLTLRTSPDAASCGFVFEQGHRYRVYAVGGLTGACSGNRDLGAAPDVPLEDEWPWALTGMAALALVGAVVAAFALLRYRAQDRRSPEL